MGTKESFGDGLGSSTLTHFAKNQGRFIGRAPIGYNNARDDEDKPIIVVNEQKKAIVEQNFTDFLHDVPYQAIKAKVNAQGIQFKGHDAIPRIISNYVYGGLIQTPGYKDETAKVVKGLHEPIISEELFWRAYYKLQDKTRPQGPKMVDDKVSLRGFVLCQGCGGMHTGGKSKGRSDYYYYYRCKKCRGENYSANTVHTEIGEILKYLSLQEKYIRSLKIDAEIKMEAGLKQKNEHIVKANAEFETLNEKLGSLEEKYISNKDSQETYDKWYPVFSREVNIKKGELVDLKKDDDKLFTLYNAILPRLSDLNYLYNKATVDAKQAFLKRIFWGGFTKEKIGGRTGLLNPMVEENSLQVEALLRVEKKKKA